MALSRIASAAIQDAGVAAGDLASGAAASNIGNGGVTSNLLAPGAARANFGGGAVLQVVQTVVTYPMTFAGTLADVMSVAITPSSTSSKILVQWNTVWGRGSDDYGAFYLFRNGSKMYGATGDGSYQDYQRATGAIMNRGAGQDQYVTHSITGQYLDSPASTSAQTYLLKAFCSYGSNLYLNRAEFVGDTGYQIRTFSTMTAMEIAG